MKNLVLSAMLFAGLTQAAGCIIVADDTTGTGEGSLQVSWTLLSTDLASGQNTVGQCPAGSGTIMVTATRAGDSPYTSFYRCDQGSGAPFTRLPVGNYTVFLEITDANGVVKFAESAEQQVTVTESASTPVAFSLYSDRGYFAASWNLTRMGAPTTCAAVSAGKMSVLATVSGGTTGFDDDSNQCTAGEGAAVAFTMLPIPTNTTYTVVVAALNNMGLSIGDSAPLANKTMTLGNAALDLGTVTVPIR